MPLTFLLFFLFWSLGPGLLSLWVCREGGRSPLIGLLAGLILGPPGIVAALLLVKIRGLGAEARANQPAGVPVRLSYQVPLIGRLHVSTVWALAGLAAFVCTWGAGGLGYEMLHPSAADRETSERTSLTAGVRNAQRPASPADQETLPAEARHLQANLARTQLPQATFLDSLTNQQQQPRTAPTDGGPVIAGADASAQAHPSETLAARQETPAPQDSPAPEPTRVAPSPAAAQPPPPAPQSVVGEVVRLFGSNGHRVHASVSGAGRTTTLSISGPTLTRAAGSQLLGNGRARESLRSSGVRIVVLLNGSESWTFLL
jgi:hypothetical protein